MSRSVLSYAGYRWLWVSGIFTFAGQWIQMASMGRVVYELTGSGALVGAVSGVRALPMLLLAPLFISPAPKSFGQLTDQRREADQEASDCPAVLTIPAMAFP